MLFFSFFFKSIALRILVDISRTTLRVVRDRNTRRCTKNKNKLSKAKKKTTFIKTHSRVENLFIRGNALRVFHIFDSSLGLLLIMQNLFPYR